MSDADLRSTAKQRRRKLVDLIAAALCDQEEAAERNGDEPWYGFGIDGIADLIAESVAPWVESLSAERDGLREAIETILPWLDKEAKDIGTWGSDDSPASAAALLRAALVGKDGS